MLILNRKHISPTSIFKILMHAAHYATAINNVYSMDLRDCMLTVITCLTWTFGHRIYWVCKEIAKLQIKFWIHNEMLAKKFVCMFHVFPTAMCVFWAALTGNHWQCILRVFCCWPRYQWWSCNSTPLPHTTAPPEQVLSHSVHHIIHVHTYHTTSYMYLRIIPHHTYAYV